MEEIQDSKIRRLNRSPIRKRKREFDYDNTFQKRTKKDNDGDSNYYWIIFIFGLVLFGYYYF